MILLEICPLCNSNCLKTSNYTSITNNLITHIKNTCYPDNLKTFFTISFIDQKISFIYLKENNKGYRVDYDKNYIQFYLGSNKENIVIYENVYNTTDPTKYNIEDFIFL